MDNQDKIFLDYEGNNWFERNKRNLRADEKDLPLYLIKLYDLKPKKVLEIGASNGYRLAEIHKNYNSKVYAVEPSKRPLTMGRKNGHL